MVQSLVMLLLLMPLAVSAVPSPLFIATSLHVLPGTETGSPQFVDVSAAPTADELNFSWELACASPEHLGDCQRAQSPSTARVQLFQLTPDGLRGPVADADSGAQPYVAGTPFRAFGGRDGRGGDYTLASDTMYEWVLSLDGADAATARFQTALHDVDWAPAQWIGGGTLLRGTFPQALVATPVDRASLFATSLGCFSASLNGQPVSNSTLDPGFSTVYPVRLLYRAMDVTALINQTAGATNTLDVQLGMYVCVYVCLCVCVCGCVCFYVCV
jgi:hypothetical protein